MHMFKSKRASDEYSLMRTLEEIALYGGEIVAVTPLSFRNFGSSLEVTEYMVIYKDGD